jgi:hypothetical protein
MVATPPEVRSVSQTPQHETNTFPVTVKTVCWATDPVVVAAKVQVLSSLKASFERIDILLASLSIAVANLVIDYIISQIEEFQED